jgi:hypothetical protein
MASGLLLTSEGGTKLREVLEALEALAVPELGDEPKV